MSYSNSCLSVYQSKYNSLKLYSLNRTMVGLSMYLSTQSYGVSFAHLLLIRSNRETQSNKHLLRPKNDSIFPIFDLIKVSRVPLLIGRCHLCMESHLKLCLQSLSFSCKKCLCTLQNSLQKPLRISKLNIHHVSQRVINNIR